jgi:triosephosphate isomerase
VTGLESRFLEGPMSRTRFVAGNWKMFTSIDQARDLAAAVVRDLGGEDRIRVAVCPPFPWLTAVAEVLAHSPVALGGQNCSRAAEGAYTGEVSPVMLREAGCRYVILGHSERRHGLGENDDLIRLKVRAALAAGLDLIVCVGETLEERDAGRLHEVTRRQVHGALIGLDRDTVARRVTVAYEPVWAIGTGRNASPTQAQEAHAYLRGRLREMFGEETAAAVPIQYGGSVKPENAAGILAQPDVDGALVGGASLNADAFLTIVRASAACG